MAIKINGITVIDDSRVGNLASAVAAGNITGGNLITGGLVSAVGNISGNFILGNGSQLTGIDATSIQNGTANVRTFSSANVTVSAAGNANVGVFTGGGLIVTGSIEATNGFIGLDATSIANGTANVRTFENGNVTISAAGTANVLNVTSTGADITGALDATGNISAAILKTANIFIDADTIHSTNSTITIDPSLPGVTGLVVIAGNLQVQGTTTTIDSTTVTINDLQFNVANNAASAAAANDGGIGVGPVGGEYAKWIYDNVANVWSTALGITATGNITGGNLITAGLVSLSSITKTGSNGAGNIGQSNNTFNTIFAKATSAQYADLAEMYEADNTIEPGTVVAFGGMREVTISYVCNDARVAGVISTNPSYIMNSALGGEHPVAVALTGRVPTRVTGVVRKGDMMVSAGDGTACACAAPQLGTVIGKALEDHDGESGVIEVVVGRV